MKLFLEALFFVITTRHLSLCSTISPKATVVQKTADFKLNYLIPSILFVNSEKLITHQRVDYAEKLMHLEVFKDSWYNSALMKLPRFIRKPMAKAGFRTYSSSGEMMDGIISRIFNDTTESENILSTTDNSKNCDSGHNKVGENPTRKFHSIAVFVYMWVHPKHRGLNLGDYLLSVSMKFCRDRGDEYMLLVHDDNGSGRLIEYYKQRGFVPIFDFIDKGMICKITNT